MSAGNKAAPSGIASLPGLFVSPGDGTVYIIDLAGFTRLTETWVERDARLGVERASDLATSIFTRLSHTIGPLGLQIGGFGGDSLALWAPLSGHTPTQAEFDSAINAALAPMAHAPPFRAISQAGRIWTGQAFNGRERLPVIWGDALGKAFGALKTRASQQAGAHDAGRPEGPVSLARIGEARLVDRWSLVVMLLDRKGIAAARLEEIEAAWSACVSVSRAHNSLCENLSQDEKGLFVTIGLGANTSREDIARDLAGALGGFGLSPRLRAARGHVFSTPVQLGNMSFHVCLGAPLNRAAKALADPASALAPQPTRQTPVPPLVDIVGRAGEIAKLANRLGSPHPRGAELIEISAPAGMGKSTVLGRAIEAAGLADDAALRINLGTRHAFAPYATLQTIGEAVSAPGVEGTDWAQFADTLAAKLPGCVIIDDWHWCDPASAKMFARILGAARSVRFVLVYRSDEKPPGHSVSPDLEICLDALGAAATRELIALHLGRAPQEGELDAAMRLCEGNPFWIREFASELAEAGSPGKDAATRRRKSLDGLLETRAERLSPPARALWRVLSSWQTPMDAALVQSLLGVFGTAVSSEHFDELTAIGWGRHLADPPRFALTHQILADTGRSDIPATVERPLNDRIARELTRRGGDRARIARHWARANQPLRAAIAYEQAAGKAIALGAHALGLTLLDRSRAVADISPGPARCRRRLAWRASAHWGNGEVRRALFALSQRDSLPGNPSRAPSDRARRAAQHAEFVRTEAAHFAGRLPDVMKGVWRGVALSSRTSAHPEATARRNGMIVLMLSLGRMPAGWWMRRLIARAQDTGDPRAETLLHVYHAITRLRGCHWGPAQVSTRLAYSAARETHDPLLQGVVIALDASRHLLRGDGEACIDVYCRLADLAQQQPNRMYQSWADYGQAQGHLILGQPETALELAERARARRATVGDHVSAGIIEGVLGRAACACGDMERAVWHGRRALRWAQKLAPSNYTSLEGIAAPAQLAACAAIARGRSNETLERMQKQGRKALGAYAALFPFARPRLAHVDGLIAQARGDTAGACKKIGRALARAESLGMNHEVDLARTALRRIGETPA
jgi:hypothetical protein